MLPLKVVPCVPFAPATPGVKIYSGSGLLFSINHIRRINKRIWGTVWEATLRLLPGKKTLVMQKTAVACQKAHLPSSTKNRLCKVLHRPGLDSSPHSLGAVAAIQVLLGSIPCPDAIHYFGPSPKKKCHHGHPPPANQPSTRRRITIRTEPPRVSVWFVLLRLTKPT
jgi:hypothetical protein